jgi:CheY-like chemotaxis protein/anti-sigma regulatory factor (Ser/Thr protein kinase)
MPKRGLTVRGDPTRLSQVVSNLLTNAAKYTPNGGRIGIHAQPEGDEIVLRVRDNGIGIAPETLPRVFDLFVQEGQAIDRAQGGLGLGLTIVRNLVERHGGRVSAHSDGRGRGSEFVVRLPKAVAAQPDSEQPIADRPGAVPPTTSSLRVLVVDDNVDGAEMLAELLGARGYEARVAHDGPSALAIADTFRPHVSLLDIGLPVMDGFELAGQLRKNPGLQNTCLIAVTGYGQEADRQKTRAAGFRHHLVKPVDLKSIDTVLAGENLTLSDPIVER